MAALRNLLMYCSALTAAIIFAGWIFFSRAFDIMPFGLIVLFSANAFYLYFSRPTVHASDILDKASAKLTLASLELKYLSKQARIREQAAEEMRIANVEREEYKLRVAKDILDHMQLKIASRRNSASDAQQIIHRPHVGNEILADLTATHKPEPIERPVPASLPTAKVGQPAMPHNIPPAPTSLN